MKYVEVEYIDSGTFVGSEEELYVAGVTSADTAMILSLAFYELEKKRMEALERVAGEAIYSVEKGLIMPGLRDGLKRLYAARDEYNRAMEAYRAQREAR